MTTTRLIGVVVADYERLVNAGYHGHEAPKGAFWGQRHALIHDPDGNSVVPSAPLPQPGGTP
jgi:uncharacterized glyoxalase superfamily protein PhnB